jgi:2'-5' RNA ligase
MRLFTGISLPHEAESRMMSLIGEIRPHASLAWTPKEKLHITTKFIGEWPEARLSELRQALAQIHAASPIEISLRGIGWLPNLRNPTILYAGVEPVLSLIALASATDAVLAPLGIAREARAYRPHVTLARVRDHRGSNLAALRTALNPHERADFAHFHAPAFHLYLSDSGQYTKLSDYPLPSA